MDINSYVPVLYIPFILDKWGCLYAHTYTCLNSFVLRWVKLHCGECFVVWCRYSCHIDISCMCDLNVYIFDPLIHYPPFYSMIFHPILWHCVSSWHILGDMKWCTLIIYLHIDPARHTFDFMFCLVRPHKSFSCVYVHWQWRKAVTLKDKGKVYRYQTMEKTKTTRKPRMLLRLYFIHIHMDSYANKTCCRYMWPKHKNKMNVLNIYRYVPRQIFSLSR